MFELRRTIPLLGTVVELGVKGASAAGLTAALARGFEQIELAHRRWSFQAPDSELTQLNQADGHSVVLSAEGFRLLSEARALMISSHGLFNCTVGGALVAQGALPDHGGRPALPLGTADDIELLRGTARLKRPLRITLDGVARGFAIDLACRAMRYAGTSGGWVMAGHDVRVFGDHQVEVPVPRPDGGTTLFTLRDGALSSSSVRAPGMTGAPTPIVGRDPAAVGVWTVLARQAWRADALTKVAALAPADQREALLTQLRGRLWRPEADLPGLRFNAVVGADPVVRARWLQSA